VVLRRNLPDPDKQNHQNHQINKEETIMKELIEAVEHMRFCQQEYFRTRNYAALDNAKKAERKVDEMLAKLRIGPNLNS
jgi:hypothetical protein